jgi:aspartate racemase
VTKLSNRSGAEVFGVVGGMGPVASAEFLKTVYEYSLGDSEQDFPVVFLYSDPTFPDRTDAFLRGDDEPLLRQLVRALRALRRLRASRVVLCCMTIHYLLPRLPPELRAGIVSLLDVTAAAVEHTGRRHLLICSNGTRRLRLFEGHERQDVFNRHLVFPSEEDQQLIHRDLIYPIKKTPDLTTLMPLLESLLEKYGVDSFAAGCSEIHLLAKHFCSPAGSRKPYGCVDPLAIVARSVGEGRTGDLP